MFIREVLGIKGDFANLAIEPDAPITLAVKRMLENDVGSLLVMRDGVLVGFISERAILRGLSAHDFAHDEIRVSEWMEKEPVVVTLDDSVDYARGVMTKSHISHLIVLDGNQVAGVISFHDVARACLKEARFENTLLKRYIKNWPE